MECRSGCAACCIAISISSPIPGLPNGKAAGVPCIHLDEQRRCKLFGKSNRPKTCLNFKPDPEFCGKTKDDAMRILSQLESECEF